MKLNDRLTKIEKMQRSPMLPALKLIRIIYEPSKTGPREVGAFARILPIGIVITFQLLPMLLIYYGTLL